MTMRKYIKDNKPKWMDNIEIQSHLIDKALIEVSNNYEICMNKFKKYKIPFDLKIKSKKDKYQTINIEKVMLNKDINTLFSGIKINNKSLFKNIKMSESISKYDICDSSITCNTRLNEYFLNLNYHDSNKKNKNILLNKKVCSIDPGLKCFLNIYSDNNVDQIGIGITSKMNKICKEIDIIQSKMTKKEGLKYKLNCKKRRNLKKALHRKIRYLDNIKCEMHNKSIKYLCDNYGKIILPKLETQEISCKFNSKLARSLYNLSNYKFIKKLENRCKEYDIELVIRPEYYTSKTCTRCGCIKHDLKLADRTYKCTKCHLEIDRDINAARNIMLRNN
jgi:IS605 OrfB family transposase